MKIVGSRTIVGGNEAFSFVLKHGVAFTPAKLPPGIRRRKAGRCYENSAHFILGQRHTLYQYVEGFAFDPLHKVAFRHAWITTDGHDALDLTLAADECGRHEYVGLVFSTPSVGRILIARGYHGLLDPVDELVISELSLETTLGNKAEIF